MMKHEFEKYDEYKDSRVEWIQELPTDWNIKRLKEVLVEAVYGISEKTKEFGKYEVLGMGDIYEGKVIFPKKRFIDHVQDNLILKKGDLLYNRTNSIALVGKVGLIEEEPENVTFASYLIRLRVKNNQYNKYFWYFLNSQYFIDYSRANAIQTANQANLSSSKLKQFKVIDINLNLQKTIANYLDTKTAQIDQKINLLTKKSAKYSELKQSLINETITHGLDKTVVMKDSEIEWIGEIPEYWKVKRFKDYYLSSMGNTILKSELVENGKIPVYSATAEDKYFGFINNSNIILNKNDLVIPARGNSIGYVKIVREKCTLTQTSIACKRQRSICSRYIYYFLLGNRFDIFKFDDTAIPQFTVEDTNSINILYPPLEEQKAIANYLDTKTAQIDRIVETINTEIEKLKELRKTLINDVVTGKIKVTTEGE